MCGKNLDVIQEEDGFGDPICCGDLRNNKLIQCEECKE